MDEVKTCPRCVRDKPLSEFNTRGMSSSTVNSYCKVCQRDYSKKHYRKNKKKHNSNRVLRKEKRRKEVRAFMKDYKESLPCKDCNNFYPHWAMEFDHVNGTKKFALASATEWSDEAIRLEMEKCELVCCMCHRFRTNGLNFPKWEGKNNNIGV